MTKPNDLAALIDLTKTTQTLLAHYLSSLSLSPSTTAAPSSSTTPSATLPNPLDVTKACTTLLKSHTTTLSLLLLTPPLTPSALITKIGDASSNVLSGLVAAATTARGGEKDELGSLMRGELRTGVRRVLGAWGEVLILVLVFATRRQGVKVKKDEGPTESERQEVLAATGMVWEACDALLKLCDSGIVGLVVKKAQEWRSVLLDAVEELKEWGEDVDDDDDDADDAEGSDVEDDEFRHEDDIFGAANKLGKADKEVKALLDTSVKKLKMVGMLYQALIKRRLRTFPMSSAASPATNGDFKDESKDPLKTLEGLMKHLRVIPETVDDLASAFYDLDEDEARKTFRMCCGEAKSAVALVRQSWTGTDDEFTTWSGKWIDALEAS